MVLDDDIMDLEEHAAMLQNKALIQNNVVSKRKEQLKHWENSEMNKLCPRRQIQQTKVKFQDRDIFLSACQSGDEEEVEGLLQKGSDINVSSIDGVTALHQAVIDGNADIVRFLIEHDADINAQDNEGWTPLHAAVCCGNLNITKFLYEHGADLSCVNSDKELPIDLAENDEIRVFLEKEMLRTGVDEQKAREREFNVMLDDCSRWIQSGKYVDAPHPRTGATALHVAASKGYNKLIGMLLRAGANINAQDFEGWTPLHAAAHWGERDACRILMENGASLEAVTHSGHSVLAVADKSIEEYLNELKEKFNELRSGALLQHHQQSNGILQDASNLATDPEKELFAVNGGDRIVANQPGLHGTEKLQSAAIRRISSGDKLATKRKEMRESDENLLLATKRSSPAPPVPAERHSLVRREETNGRAGPNNEVGQALDFAKMEDKSARPAEDEDEEYEDEEEVDDESEWTEVTATPSSSTAAPAAAASAATVASDTDNTNKASSFTDRIVNQRDPYSSNTFRRENPETTTSHAGKVEGIKFPQLEAQKVNGPLPSAAPTPICGSSSAASVAETTASSSSSSGKHREREEKTTATSGSTKEEGSTSSSSSTRESSHSASPSYSTDRSNTGSGVSSIQTSSRSVTPKDCSSSLYSSDQSIQCVVRVGQPASNSQQKSLSSTSSTTTNNSNKAHSTKTNHKSAVLRAAEETVKRLRKQLPNVQTGVDRAKSQSVDFGKPSPLLDSPLKSPPASAPLVQSARLFWNSIGNNGNNPPTAGQQQNHPLGSTQLHQQQFHRSRQRFANSTNSFDSDSPFAIVAGEQKSSEKLFKRGDSLKTGMGLSATSSFQSQNGHRRQHQKQAPPPPVERLTKMTKPEDFLFGSSTATIQTGTTSMPPPAAPLAAITSASNTPSESQNSSVTHSPSPSPLINSPFVTIRKQSWQQSTPPTQPTSQKESESERKAKSKLKRSTRRSTQGVTLEQMGEANRMQAQLNHGRNESHKLSEDRIQQVNAKFNQMMEMQKVPRDPPQELHHQLQPPSSPGCSSASSSSAYITASNSRHAAAAAVSQHQASTAQPKDDPPAVPIVNFSSTALLIDELNKYKQLYEQERDECERLRLQVQELSADSRAKASNVLRGVGWRPGATLIQRTELPSGITYSTVTRSISRPLSDEKLATRLNADEKQNYEKRISELENELENLRELRVKNDLLKKENEALVRILARNTRNNYLTSEQRNPDRTDSAMKT